MIFPCPSPRAMFFNPCKNHAGYRSCLLAAFLHYQVAIERSELSCPTRDPKSSTLLAASNFHVLSTSIKYPMPMLLWPHYLVGWNMCQAAERCFKKAQELEWSFQTPEGSNAAFGWLNAVEKERDHSCWYRVSSGVSCHRQSSTLHSLTVLLCNESNSYTAVVHQPACPKCNTRH